MSEISKKKVLQIANLAHLNLSDQEVDLYQKELSLILKFIDQLQAVTVKDLVATEQVTNLKNVMRVDEPWPDLYLKVPDLLKQLDSLSPQGFSVPKVNF